jgi:hypothetical protein
MQERAASGEPSALVTNFTQSGARDGKRSLDSATGFGYGFQMGFGYWALQMQVETPGIWVRGSERFGRLGTLLLKGISAGVVYVLVWHLIGCVNR